MLIIQNQHRHHQIILYKSHFQTKHIPQWIFHKTPNTIHHFNNVNVIMKFRIVVAQNRIRISYFHHPHIRNIIRHISQKNKRGIFANGNIIEPHLAKIIHRSRSVYTASVLWMVIMDICICTHFVSGFVFKFRLRTSSVLNRSNILIVRWSLNGLIWFDSFWKYYWKIVYSWYYIMYQCVGSILSSWYYRYYYTCRYYRRLYDGGDLWSTRRCFDYVDVKFETF